MLRRLGLACVVVVGLFCLAYGSQEPRLGAKPRGEEPVGVRELAELLKEKLDPRDFAKSMTLKEFIALFKQKLAAAGKDVPIVVRWEAFNEENPDSYPDRDALLNTELKSFVEPELMGLRISASTVFGSGLAKLPTHNAAFVVNPGYLEITTVDRSGIEARLGQRLNVRFNRRPLADALEDLYELTGIPIVLDSRAARVAQMPITATFTLDVSLGSALLVMSEMAGLKLVVGNNLVYLTTPAHAQQFLLERWWNPYGLPTLQGSGYGWRLKRIEAVE